VQACQDPRPLGVKSHACTLPTRQWNARLLGKQRRPGVRNRSAPFTRADLLSNLVSMVISASHGQHARHHRRVCCR
jgi:hypothetical protein